MNISLAQAVDLSGLFDSIRLSLSKDTIQIENIDDALIILNDDGSELSTEDQTAVQSVIDAL